MSGGTGAGAADRPTVVVLAAGAGTRFGGRKELAAVGAAGEAIMDVVVRRAAAAGFGRAVIVVAPGMAETVRDHLAAHVHAGPAGPPDVAVDVVVQPAVPGRAKPLGTAAAVLAARHLIDGTFVVVNGDDAYPADAFSLLAEHLRAAPSDEHALVAFRVVNTLTSASRPVSRAALAVGVRSQLLGIREGTVVRGPDGLLFERDASVEPLPGHAPVSMNMWGFRASVWRTFASSVDEFVASGRAGEVFLPDVVTALVRAGAVVRVLVSESVCVGVTHPEDVGAVRKALS